MTDNIKNKNNKGYLYPNTNKTKATQPDYTGKVIIENEGVVFEKRLAAWENTDPNGKRYLSIIASEPIPQDNKPNANSSNSTTIQKNPVSSPISEDLEDLDAILRSADDDNPFGN